MPWHYAFFGDVWSGFRPIKRSVQFQQRNGGGGLGGILIISGLKLLNVPYANWVLGFGLGTLIVVLAIYTASVLMGEPRTTPERA